MTKQRTAQVTVPPEEGSDSSQEAQISLEEVVMLRGFASLVSERWGYLAGRKMKSAELSEATKVERKAISVARKTYGETVGLLISGDTDKAVADLRTAISVAARALETSSEELATKATPFREAMKPLSKAITYMDRVVIPDSLKELGKPVEARFSLSEHVAQLIADAEKKKKAQK